jgi:hypothetical protein
MATYTYDITTEIGQVRRLIDDIDIVPTTDAAFSDEEIQFFINLGGSVLMGASKACGALASKDAGSLAGEKIGDYSYTKKTSAQWATMAKEFAIQDASIPAQAISEWDLTQGSGITVEED